MHPFHFSLEEGKKLRPTAGTRSAQVFKHGSMQVRLYEPKGVDDQSPHDQDEIYVIASGEGWFQNGKGKHSFCMGDAIFVPARQGHRFYDFSEDFSTWVIFYGPQGGEKP